MTYFLLLTAFTVSIDSFVCGFSLSFAGKRKYLIVPIIALTVFIMCLIANYLTTALAEYINEKTAGLGGIILIGVGIFNLLKKDKNEERNGNGILKQSLITGFAVGLDGAAANLSLALMGISAFYVPVTIAVMHAVMITLGIILAQTSIAKKFETFNFIPPIILIILGTYKVISIFL